MRVIHAASVIFMTFGILTLFAAGVVFRTTDDAVKQHRRAAMKTETPDFANSAQICPYAALPQCPYPAGKTVHKPADPKNMV